MSLWGWIPNLTEGRSPVPVPASVRESSEAGSRQEYESPVYVDEASVSKDGCDIILLPLGNIKIHVGISSGFFVIKDDVDSILSVEGLDEFVYITLRRHYHLDVTHGEYGGLHFIEVDSFEDAVRATASLFVSWTESMDAERLYDDLPPASEYIARHGFIKYGISFVNTYSEELGQDAGSYKEILTSLDVFYETSYDHYKNENLEKLSKASTELAKRSTTINEDVLVLTKLVIFLTISGIVISIADLALTHWKSDSLLFTVILVFMLLVTSWGILAKLNAGSSGEIVLERMESGSDSLSLRHYLCVTGMTLSVIVLSICYLFSVFNALQAVVLIIVSIVMFFTLLLSKR